MSGPTLLRLKIRDPQGQEREATFAQEIVTIGRAGECDLTLESGFISRLHARLLHSHIGWQIADEDSKNGVFVNGQRVAGSAPFAEGDALRIGDFGVTVVATEATEAAAVESTVIAPPGAAGIALPAGVSDTEPEAEHAVRVVSPALLQVPASGDAAGQPGVDEGDAAETEAPLVDDGGAPTDTPDSSEQQQLSSADTGLSEDLTTRERVLVEALLAAGLAGAGPARLAAAVWGTGGGDAEMLERLLARAQQKLGTRQIVRLPGGILRLE